jgi:hypothetical protein
MRGDGGSPQPPSPLFVPQVGSSAAPRLINDAEDAPGGHKAAPGLPLDVGARALVGAGQLLLDPDAELDDPEDDPDDDEPDDDPDDPEVPPGIDGGCPVVPVPVPFCPVVPDGAPGMEPSCPVPTPASALPPSW